MMHAKAVLLGIGIAAVLVAALIALVVTKGCRGEIPVEGWQA